MEKDFEFSIKGNKVEDLKEIMATEIVKVEVEKPVIKEVEVIKEVVVEGCPICGSKNIIWHENAMDWSHPHLQHPENLILIQQGNCQICVFGQSKRREQ